MIAQCDPDRPNDAEEYDAYYDAVLSEAARLAEEITSHGLHEQIAFLWLYGSEELEDLLPGAEPTPGALGHGMIHPRDSGPFFPFPV